MIKLVAHTKMPGIINKVIDRECSAVMQLVLTVILSGFGTKVHWIMKRTLQNNFKNNFAECPVLEIESLETRCPLKQINRYTDSRQTDGDPWH